MAQSPELLRSRSKNNQDLQHSQMLKHIRTNAIYLIEWRTDYSSMWTSYLHWATAGVASVQASAWPQRTSRRALFRGSRLWWRILRIAGTRPAAGRGAWRRGRPPAEPPHHQRRLRRRMEAGKAQETRQESHWVMKRETWIKSNAMIGLLNNEGLLKIAATGVVIYTASSRLTRIWSPGLILRISGSWRSKTQETLRRVDNPCWVGVRVTWRLTLCWRN